MKHYSKIEITDFVYNELSKEKMEEMKIHINSCDECNSVYSELLALNQSLNVLDEVYPLENSFELIMDQIEKEQKQFNWQVPSIIVSILAIFSVLYFSNDTLLSLPFVNEINKLDLFNSISNFTKSLIIFFGFGSLVTIAITPVLVKENQLQEVISL